jgi:transglutaminase-like putative cysteine protease
MAVLFSCNNHHLIVDRELRNTVFDDYRERSEIYASSRKDLFSLADSITDGSLREAVCFILAYMPLSDMAVYEPGYLLENSSMALRARKEMPWGNDIPDELFLNFVLPLRVNNENPDDFRTTCYEELKNRVEGMDALEAALEINRWCQERVAYQPSDSRTSSPLATILSARGRCGEESTLTVSALRTAGIPARQVYTPRWAHTDDNHAWVEFWAAGGWHYLGACEPEPVPDRGWFTEPARRAMLVHTRAFGKYTGGETLVRSSKLFSEINTLARYAETKELRVRVKDTDGNPVPRAEAGYMLFNYAEFYPLATLECNNDGECVMMTGFGSLLIWADDGLRYGYSLASPSDTVTEVTISTVYPEDHKILDLKVPVAPVPFAALDVALADENNRVLKRGDSIRNEYISSWLDETDIERVALQAGIPEESTAKILKASMGNCMEIAAFLGNAGTRGDIALRILENVSEKDLRDTPASVFADHLDNVPVKGSCTDTTLYDRFVLSPRISNEILSPFRGVLLKLPGDLLRMFRTDPATIVSWTDTVIAVTDSENYYGTPLTPEGVLRLHAADKHSRDIFFVALCRTAGVAARLAPGTGRPQYYDNGEWHDVWFTGESKPSGSPGYITFVAGEKDFQPEYHIHFTLSHLKDGKCKTLDYGYGVKIEDMPGHIPLEPGTYVLTTGNRDENGNVLASMTFIEVNPGEEKEIKVSQRKPGTAGIALGRIDLNAEMHSLAGRDFSPGSISGKGLVLMWIEPGKEPSRHLLNDLPAHAKEFTDWGGWFIILTDPALTTDTVKPSSIAGMPLNTILVSDKDMEYMKTIAGIDPAGRQLPVVLYCNSNGEILFSSEGYRIDTGEQILKKIRQ